MAPRRRCGGFQSAALLCWVSTHFRLLAAEDAVVADDALVADDAAVVADDAAEAAQEDSNRTDDLALGCPSCTLPFDEAVVARERATWRKREDRWWLDQDIKDNGFACDQAMTKCLKECPHGSEKLWDLTFKSCDMWKCLVWCAKEHDGKGCLKPYGQLCYDFARMPQGAGSNCTVDCSSAHSVVSPGMGLLFALVCCLVQAVMP
eukprot:TRINITY_DN44935_c0_g1_i1.p1 TRINITY_DN44935_c0_g1~~TRINITY_DN44935_c0_g1_i1.p1  ORF type:complete len:225 (+),score=43.90 TRINITY_DN44935_c0_g1_i1:61-675(+)